MSLCLCDRPLSPCCLPPIKIPAVIKADQKPGNAACKGERACIVIMWRERASRLLSSTKLRRCSQSQGSTIDSVLCVASINSLPVILVRLWSAANKSVALTQACVSLCVRILPTSDINGAASTELLYFVSVKTAEELHFHSQTPRCHCVDTSSVSLHGHLDFTFY